MPEWSCRVQPMRIFLLAFTTCTALMAPAPARADEPMAEPATEVAANDEATPGAAASDEATTKDDPKLPNAGAPIKIDLPQKKAGASLLWQPRWRKFSNAEYVVTGVSLAAAVASLFVPPRPGMQRLQRR